MAKNRRFGDLVRESGRPEVVALWTSPNENRPFMKAVKQNRVLTIFQEPASKRRDFGEIGFHQAPHASYFVFPRPLPNTEPHRVIGINYQLAQELETSPTPPEKAIRPQRPKHIHISKAEPEAPPPAPEKEFRFKIRRTATTETVVPIKAKDRKAARLKAREIADHQSFDLESADVRNEITLVS